MKSGEVTGPGPFCYRRHRMDTATLFAHSWLRWLIILLGLFAVARAVSGRVSGRPWLASDESPGRFYTIAIDVQMLLGLLLYFVFSDLLTVARLHPTAIMCAEAVPWRCHRTLVGDALLVRGIEVVDIFDQAKATPETLTRFAVVDGLTITYPADD